MNIRSSGSPILCPDARDLSRVLNSELELITFTVDPAVRTGCTFCPAMKFCQYSSRF